MKKSFYLLVTVVITMGFFACGAKHTEENKNFVGTYQGELPCADCEGINTILTLKSDSTFTLDELYNKGSQGAIFHYHSYGKIVFGEKGKISLTDNDDKTRYYELGDSTITMLDTEGKRIEGETAPFYTLKKIEGELPAKLITYYQGDLPCADCNGIRTTLTLLYNDQFALSEMYSKGDKGDYYTYYSSGKIVRGEGGKFSLTDRDGQMRYYEFGDSTITVLNAEGKRAEGETASLYELKKMSQAPCRKIN